MYQHVLKVWNNFELNTKKDYHDFYLKCDILLFADVFKKFRNICLENYGWCIFHHLSTLALSWESMLIMTGVHLNLISDVDISLFFEKGMIGGFSYISKRHRKKNGKY